MPLLYSVLALVFIGIGLIWFNPRLPLRAAGPSPTPAAGVRQEETRNLSRSEIAKRLAVLAESPPPKDLNIGAMCYRVALKQERIEYVCPVCGEKTIYNRSWEFAGLEYCRQLVKEIRRIRVALDESQFCKQCSPKIVTPQLGLTVDYPGTDKDHKIWGIRSEDLVLLNEFLAESLKHKSMNDSETPLKDHLKRLEEILGVKL